MDSRERIYDGEETLRQAFDGFRARIWTALPGIVKAFHADLMTVDVQPAINGYFPLKDGTLEEKQMPVLGACPVVWQGGGGVTATFPIAPGDECLIVFSSRCIDSWWQLGGVQGQAELRMHNLSDGFVIVGLRSQARKFNVDTAAACLTSDDGLTVIKLNPAAKTLTMSASGGINLNGVAIDSGGNITAPGDVKGAGISLDNHTHVDPQGGIVGKPQ